MAINRAVRGKGATCVEPEILAESVAQESCPVEGLLAIERAEQLQIELDRLGEMDRQTLVAFYVDGHSRAEMADGFSAPLGTIKRRLHVARKRLAQEVEALASL